MAIQLASEVSGTESDNDKKSGISARLWIASEPKMEFIHNRRNIMNDICSLKGLSSNPL
jgi:hypothetical protein